MYVCNYVRLPSTFFQQLAAALLALLYVPTYIYHCTFINSWDISSLKQLGISLYWEPSMLDHIRMYVDTHSVTYTYVPSTKHPFSAHIGRSV